MATENEVQTMTLEEMESTLPTMMQELKTSHESLQEIAAYCRQLPVDEESMKSTKQYVQDAALNIAYHVHRYSSYFTTYLMLQDEDVESLQASTLALTAQQDSIKERKEGFEPYLTLAKKEAKAKVADVEPVLPRKKRRSPLNLDALDGIGVSQQEDSALDIEVAAAPASVPAPGIPEAESNKPPAAPPPPLPADVPPPPAAGPPPTSAAPPPPPVDLPPPSFS